MAVRSGQHTNGTLVQVTPKLPDLIIGGEGNDVLNG